MMGTHPSTKNGPFPLHTQLLCFLMHAEAAWGSQDWRQLPCMWQWGSTTISTGVGGSSWYRLHPKRARGAADVPR